MPHAPQPIIILIGMQASGKGTYGKMLAEKYHFTHISMGDILRERIHEEVSSGMTVKDFVTHGELVPDTYTCTIVRDLICKQYTHKPIFLDGFPRNKFQAKFLKKLKKETNRPIGAIYFSIEKPIAIARMHARGRGDDDSITISSRLVDFFSQTIPIISICKKMGPLLDVKSFDENISEEFIKNKKLSPEEQDTLREKEKKLVAPRIHHKVKKHTIYALLNNFKK